MHPLTFPPDAKRSLHSCVGGGDGGGGDGCEWLLFAGPDAYHPPSAFGTRTVFNSTGGVAMKGRTAFGSIESMSGDAAKPRPGPGQSGCPCRRMADPSYTSVVDGCCFPAAFGVHNGVARGVAIEVVPFNTTIVHVPPRAAGCDRALHR